MDMYKQGRLGSACTSVKSDLSVHSLREEYIQPMLSKQRKTKINIKLHGCARATEGLHVTYVQRGILQWCNPNDTIAQKFGGFGEKKKTFVAWIILHYNNITFLSVFCMNFFLYTILKIIGNILFLRARSESDKYFRPPTVDSTLNAQFCLKHVLGLF